jgi:hypothetical protein
VLVENKWVSLFEKRNFFNYLEVGKCVRRGNVKLQHRKVSKGVQSSA